MTNDAKVILFNENIERKVLSNLLSFRDLIMEWQEFLTEDMFYLPKHRILYGAIKSVYDNGDIPDLETVCDFLMRHPVAGAPEIYEVAEIQTSTTSSAAFGQHISLLTDLAERRRYWRLGNRLIAAGTDLSVDINEIDKSIDAERERNTRKSKTFDIRVANGILQERMSRNCNGVGTMLQTGFPTLDDKGGLQEGDIVLVGGATSMGKTTFVTNMTWNVAASGIPSMMFTLEMTVEQLSARINAPYCGVPSYVLLFKKLRSDQLRYVEEAMRQTEKVPFIIEDSLTTYETIKESIRSNAIKGGVRLFVIDYLQILGCLRSKNETEASFYERACRELKNLAKELRICVVLVVQFNREVKGEDPRPRKEWIRGSGGIEQAADTILLLYRPNYYGKRHKYRPEIPPTITEVIIDKGRNIGGSGTFFADYKNEQFFEYVGVEIESAQQQVPRQGNLPF